MRKGAMKAGMTAGCAAGEAWSSGGRLQVSAPRSVLARLPSALAYTLAY